MPAFFKKMRASRPRSQGFSEVAVKAKNRTAQRWKNRNWHYSEDGFTAVKNLLYPMHPE